MANKYNYYDPKKVIKHGRNCYSGGSWAKFPVRKPKVSNNKVLIGILSTGNPPIVGAVEITNQKVFDDFCDSYGGSWFCTGAMAYLYILPKAKANECKSRSSTKSFRIGELENLILKSK